MQDITIFLPLRAGSQRSVRKNTKQFSSDGLSLFQNKMHQVLALKDRVKEIIVSSNDPEVEEQFGSYACDRVKFVRRPDELCSSTTKVVDLINYVPTIVESEHILWLHATAPFVDADDYSKAINLYQDAVENHTHDSLMSVNKIQQFLWNDQSKSIINCNRSINPWPNTQDLAPLYEINHAFYISSRTNYLNLNDRIGVNPYLFVLEGEKKIDIDWEEDFKFAQLVAKAKKNNG